MSKERPKQRTIRPHFWDDNWIISLDPIEKLLYIYLFSNSLVRICGIYEISIRRIGFDTGIDPDMVKKILRRFEDDQRVVQHEGWVCLPNFIKNQALNPSVISGILREISETPRNIYAYFYDNSDRFRQSVDSLGTGWGEEGTPNLTQPNLTQPKNIQSAAARPTASKFELFWTAYPKKEKKKQALDIWKRKQLDRLADQILAFIARAKETDRWQRGFIKQPTTFLNSESWEDDLAAYQEGARGDERLVIKLGGSR